MYIRIAFSIELRLRVSRSLRSLANYRIMVIAIRQTNCTTVPYLATGMICSSLLSVIVMLAISLLFCKMSSELQKRKKKVANIKNQSGIIAMAPDTTLQITREPIYDDIELTDKTSTIDLSKNVAYA